MIRRWEGGTCPDTLVERHIAESPYVYCNNNPIRFIDPDGRDKNDRVLRRAY